MKTKNIQSMSMPKMKMLMLLAVALIMLFAQPYLFAQDSILLNKKIKVGVANTPPFVIEKEDGNYSGLCVDLWQKIAEQKQWEFEYVSLTDKSLAEMINSVSIGKVDICINPLTVTSQRLEKLNFTQPVYISDLSIATNMDAGTTILSFLKNFFSYNFLEVIFLLFLVIFIFGFLLWVVEHKHNVDQFRKGLKGLGDGIWWSAVTMTTVGYGDKSPKTKLGRFIGVIWMFTAVIIISSFTAGIASSLTVHQLGDKINDLNDLKHFTVGTINGSSSAELLKHNGIAFKAFANTDLLLDALLKEDVTTVLYDQPLLQYEIYDKGYNDRIELLPNRLKVEYYSFSMSKENAYIENEINELILSQIESEDWVEMLSVYHLRK